MFACLSKGMMDPCGERIQQPNVNIRKCYYGSRTFCLGLLWRDFLFLHLSLSFQILYLQSQALFNFQDINFILTKHNRRLLVLHSWIKETTQSKVFKINLIHLKWLIVSNLLIGSFCQTLEETYLQEAFHLWLLKKYPLIASDTLWPAAAVLWPKTVWISFSSFCMY